MAKIKINGKVYRSVIIASEDIFRYMLNPLTKQLGRHRTGIIACIGGLIFLGYDAYQSHKKIEELSADIACLNENLEYNEDAINDLASRIDICKEGEQ